MNLRKKKKKKKKLINVSPRRYEEGRKKDKAYVTAGEGATGIYTESFFFLEFRLSLTGGRG